MSARRRNRRRVEPTDEWEALVPLFLWPEQEDYEVIRPLLLFGSSVAERAKETGTSSRTLYFAGWIASRSKGWNPSLTPSRPRGGEGFHRPSDGSS